MIASVQVVALKDDNGVPYLQGRRSERPSDEVAIFGLASYAHGGDFRGQHGNPCTHPFPT
eukprot:1510178-Pleurochrysis_carterae.AAC.1